MSETGPSISSSTLEYYHSLPKPEGRPPRQRYWLHALLLLATVFTTLVVGARLEFNFLNNLPTFKAGNEIIPYFPIGWALAQPSRLLLGIPFSLSLLIILLSHEMGHYLFCRFYGVYATLPFFIPAPSLIGTLGAVIRIKAPIRSRAALFDIGIAGPIAGFMVAVITLAIAFMFSKPLGRGGGVSELQLGFPAIFYVVHSAVLQVFPHRAVAILPLSQLYLHPMAVAAWVGMYATALNLLPSGQLDGGHIVYALAPRAHRLISWITIFVLVGLGAMVIRQDHKNSSWWFWAVILIMMNVLGYRLEQAPDYPLLPRSRWILGIAAAGMLALTFTVSPFHMAW